MKIIVIGATGVIGAAVSRALAKRHEVIGVSRHGDPSVDIEKPATIPALFARVAKPDAVVVCAGTGAFKPLMELTDQDLAHSIGSKLMGQVNVIREAFKHLSDRGSVTVTTGVLAHSPTPGTAALAMINCGVEGFVRGAAVDAPRGLRVNAISPPWMTESLIALKMDPTHGIPADDAAKAYVAAVEGTYQGQTLDCRRFL
jgi:NAD(P)-dependent dehydrogenase (short-subunit alcohol dehydrogenase family)